MNTPETEITVEEELGTERKLRGKFGTIVYGLATVSSLYHLYALFVGLIPPHQHNSMHLLFSLTLLFLTKKAHVSETSKKAIIRDTLIAFICIAVFSYVVIGYENIIERAVTPNTVDQLLAVIAVVLVLEACRRSYGNVLPGIALFFIGYAFLGRYIPGALGHRGWTLKRFTFMLFMQTEGIFGVATRVSAKEVFMFLLFGALLMASGGGKKLMDMAYSLAGKFRGGPAKVATIASGLFGMVSGSAVANAVTTGQFTIPVMKRAGYEPHFAGAVVAVASTGGLVMPPVMGAGAFIMAEILGKPYFEVAKAAIIPALLFYGSVLTVVHLEAKRLGLAGLPKEQLPQFSGIAKQSLDIIVPVAVLIYLIANYTPIIRAALYAMALIVIFNLIQIKNMNKLNLRKIIEALKDASMSARSVCAACATAGIIIAIINGTGLGLAFASYITNLGKGSILAVLVLTMVVLIILGMGLPAIGAYMIGASIAAPALCELGIAPLAAHMFVFYFSNLSHITPPVALASYAAAGIAGAEPFKTGFTAWKLGLCAFIVPFMFIYGNELLLIGNTLNIIVAVITALVGVIALGGSLNGFLLTELSLFERSLLFISSLCMIKPGLVTDIIGIVLIIIVLISQKLRSRQVNF